MDKIIVITFKISIIIRILFSVAVLLLLCICQNGLTVLCCIIATVIIVTSVFVCCCKRCCAVINAIGDVFGAKIVVANVSTSNSVIITMITIVILGAIVNCIKHS